MTTKLAIRHVACKHHKNYFGYPRILGQCFDKPSKMLHFSFGLNIFSQLIGKQVTIAVGNTKKTIIAQTFHHSQNTRT